MKKLVYLSIVALGLSLQANAVGIDINTPVGGVDAGVGNGGVYAGADVVGVGGGAAVGPNGAGAGAYVGNAGVNAGVGYNNWVYDNTLSSYGRQDADFVVRGGGYYSTYSGNRNVVVLLPYNNDQTVRYYKYNPNTNTVTEVTVQGQPGSQGGQVYYQTQQPQQSGQYNYQR